MQNALGDRFTLITPKNLKAEVDFDFASKDFFFAAQTDKQKDSISRITAKSDFLRFKRIYDRGGIWLDADTIVISNFLEDLRPLLQTGKLVWHSEQFLGSLPGNPLIGRAVQNMIEAPRQIYANPGNIKESVRDPENRKDIVFVPPKVWDPTEALAYTAQTWETAYRTDLGIEDFMKNRECRIMKMYNSNLSTYDYSRMTVGEFLQSGILLSRVFRHIEPDIQFWVDQANSLSCLLTPEAT